MTKWVGRAIGLSSAMLMVLASPQPASARNLPQGGVTREEIVSWLGQRGLTGKIKVDEHGESIVKTAADGINFDIYFMGCSAGRCNSVQFAAGWTPMSGVTETAINNWNENHRYIRAYLQPSNSIYGEYDVDVSPGGSWEQLDGALVRWRSSVTIFAAYLNAPAS